jgi:CRP/FNR family cyclic AMP-dependent transcriptional regulator
MKDVLEYCVGGDQKRYSAGELLLREGERSGQLYILLEGQIEVVRGETVVASIVEPGAMFGEMSILLDQNHSANVRAATATTAYVVNDAASFLRDRPQLVFLIAQLLARRLFMATTYLADVKKQYAGQGNHLAMVADLLQSMINLPSSDVSPGSDLQSDPRI